MRTRLHASQPMIYVTPIVVPLTAGAFDTLTNDASSVAFDFAGTGDARAQGWLTQDAAWLVWDPNGRGRYPLGLRHDRRAHLGRVLERRLRGAARSGR
ncbi:MAG: hypothetical protein WDM79_06595 [Terricaulis sp.]